MINLLNHHAPMISEWCYIIFRRTTMQCLQNNYRDVALLADIDDIFCRVVWYDKDGVPLSLSDCSQGLASVVSLALNVKFLLSR